MSRTAVVIGAGMGGLAVSIRLALKGYSVTVYDRNPYPGGKLSHFTQDGFSFDAGPSLFTQPENIEDIFREANEPIEDYFRYESVPLACRYFFEDGTIVNAWTDKNRFAEELAMKNGEDPGTLKTYLARAEKAYKAIGTIFLDHSLHKASTWFNSRILPAISATRLSYLLRSMHGYNSAAFRNPRTVQIMDRFATYNGSDPYKAPAMLTMIPHLEQNEGTFYPMGGMISITNALYQLALKKGVQFRLGAIVRKIMKEGNTVCGVVTDAGELSADLVVSNMDVYYVYRDLLDDPAAAARVLKRERSSSALIFYWGINRSFEQLHLHNIFFSANYRAEFEHLFRKGTMFEDPTVYINITSKMEEGHCAPGTENWFVMVNAPANRGQDWDQAIAETRQRVLRKLNRILGIDIEPCIITERVLDPRGIQANSFSHMGSLYGTSSNSPWAAFLRQPNFSSSLKGLYFTGGSVHPGGGIPLCLKSARIVADLI